MPALIVRRGLEDEDFYYRLRENSKTPIRLDRKAGKYHHLFHRIDKPSQLPRRLHYGRKRLRKQKQGNVCCAFNSAP